MADLECLQYSQILPTPPPRSCFLVTCSCNRDWNDLPGPHTLPYLDYGDSSAATRWECMVAYIPQVVLLKSRALVVMSNYPVVVHYHNVFIVELRIALLIRVLEEYFSGGESFRREVFQSQRVTLLLKWPLKGLLNHAGDKEERGNHGDERERQVDVRVLPRPTPSNWTETCATLRGPKTFL